VHELFSIGIPVMNEQHNPGNSPSGEDPGYREYDLGSREDGETRTTFHVFKNERTIGYYLERVYTADGRLLRMVKRAPDGRSETCFDPDSGDIDRIFESYLLPDGNLLTKEKQYRGEDCSVESILVISPQGLLVRTVLRENTGLTSAYQGQTEFNHNGRPTVSVNHWFDNSSGKIIRKEQIQWLEDGERGVTEHFHFNHDSILYQYFKRLYHPATDRFLEETHYYETSTQVMQRKEVKTFGRFDGHVGVEITTFDENGNPVKKMSNTVERALPGPVQQRA
jgi:hypothetical protein